MPPLCGSDHSEVLTIHDDFLTRRDKARMPLDAVLTVDRWGPQRFRSSRSRWCGWARAQGLAVGGGTTPEPSPARSSEHALLGVAQFAGRVGQGDVGVAQIVRGGVSANLVHHRGECQSFV